MSSRRYSRPAKSPELDMKSTHTYRGYVFTIRYSAEDPWFVVRFADIPGIISGGPTLAKAFANGCEALDMFLECLQDSGRRPPRPRHRLLVRTSR